MPMGPVMDLSAGQWWEERGQEPRWMGREAPRWGWSAAPEGLPLAEDRDLSLLGTQRVHPTGWT